MAKTTRWALGLLFTAVVAAVIAWSQSVGLPWVSGVVAVGCLLGFAILAIWHASIESWIADRRRRKAEIRRKQEQDSFTDEHALEFFRFDAFCKAAKTFLEHYRSAEKASAPLEEHREALEEHLATAEEKAGVLIAPYPGLEKLLSEIRESLGRADSIESAHLLAGVVELEEFLFDLRFQYRKLRVRGGVPEPPCEIPTRPTDPPRPTPGS